MTKITSKTYPSRIVSSPWISNKEDPRFDSNVRIQTRSMEEQALHALKTLRKGKCIAILDSKSKEAKTNLFFRTTFLSPLFLKTLRIKARGELYIFVAHEVASTFSFIFIGEVSITHPQFYFIFKISNTLPSFPLFKLLAKTISNLVSYRILGVILQLGFLQLYLDYLVRSSFDNIDLIMYPTKRH